VQGKYDFDWHLVDAAALCGGFVEKGSTYAFLVGHGSEVFKDEDFADLFPPGRGCPSVFVELIWSVMVLQALEGLSEREAVRELKNWMDWRAACGLALDDAGFDFSKFTYWRAELRVSGRRERIFDAVRAVVDAT